MFQRLGRLGNAVDVGWPAGRAGSRLRNAWNDRPDNRTGGVPRHNRLVAKVLPPLQILHLPHEPRSRGVEFHGRRGRIRRLDRVLRRPAGGQGLAGLALGDDCHNSPGRVSATRWQPSTDPPGRWPAAERIAWQAFDVDIPQGIVCDGVLAGGQQSAFGGHAPFRHVQRWPEAGLEIRSLIKTKLPKVEFHSYPARTDTHFRRLFSVVREYLDALDSGRFNFRPGFGCQMCDFAHTHCRRWTG